jgi:hypothetical protein
VEIHECECVICQTQADKEVMAHHRHINLVLSRLGEAEQRWYVASLSSGKDAPSDRELTQISGLTEKTIRRGRKELAQGLTDTAVGQQRRKGGGRKRAEKKTQG